MTRLLCTADTHLGKSPHLYPGRLADQEAAWAATLGLARNRSCDAVLHAGDLFDMRRPGPGVLVAAERPLVAHRALGGCPVHVIAGNHDIPSLEGACGLDVLAEAGLIEAHRTPAARKVGDVFVAFLPWAPVSRLIAGLELEDRDEAYPLAADMLYRAAVDLMVEVERQPTQAPTILVAHWSVSGAQLPSGLPIESVREVILDRVALEELGFAAIVLGHIHRPGNVGGSSTTFYTGSPQTLDHGEAQVPHGVLVYDVEADTLERVELHRYPEFVTLNLDDYVDVRSNGITLDGQLDGQVVRLRDTLPAGSDVDYGMIRDTLERAGALRVDLQLTVERPERPDRGRVDLDLAPLELFTEWLVEEQGATRAGDEVDRIVELARGYLEHARDEVPA